MNDLDKTIEMQLELVFSERMPKNEKEALKFSKEAFDSNDVMMLPKGEKLLEIYNNWLKKSGAKQVASLTEDLFDSYNEAIDDVIDLIKKTKPKKEEIKKEELIEKLSKLKRD